MVCISISLSVSAINALQTTWLRAASRYRHDRLSNEMLVVAHASFTCGTDTAQARSSRADPPLPGHRYRHPQHDARDIKFCRISR
jgi:hypothetical protein